MSDKPTLHDVQAAIDAGDIERARALFNVGVSFVCTADTMRAIRQQHFEEAARIAGESYQQFLDVKEAHERFTKEPFRPEAYGITMSVVEYSRAMIDALREAGKGEKDGRH